jgi:hypothetical protein
MDIRMGWSLCTKNYRAFKRVVKLYLSRTLRKTDSDYPEEIINKGKYYPSAYDKPHDLSAVMNYKISRRWRFSGNFVLSSGRPVTLPELKYSYDGKQIVYYSDRNKYRMPPYHRLDLSITFDENLRRKRMWKGSWTSLFTMPTDGKTHIRCSIVKIPLFSWLIKKLTRYTNFQSSGSGAVNHL